MYKILSLLLLLSILLLPCSPTLLLTQPAVTSFPNSQITYWYANFGIIHYNKPMSFSLFVTNSSLCGIQEQDTNLKQFITPTYVVVKEGVCSYPQKALHAQNLGAQGVIFASDQVKYASGDIVLSSDQTTGRKIKIAALFIEKSDFEKLSTLNNPKIKVDFQISRTPSPSVTIFLSSSGRQNYIFLRNFRTLYDKLSSYLTNIQVVYHSFPCEFCQQSQCILQKKACTFDMQYYKSNVGRFILQEQFRQYRIFQTVKKQQGNIGKWFQYMDRFDNNCDEDWTNAKTCSENILKQLKINNLNQIQNQYDLITTWKQIQTKTGIISLPDISVNNMRHTELLTADSAYQMICASIQSSPCQDESATGTGNKSVIIVVVVVSSVVLILSGIYCYKKVIRKQITNDMSSRVSELVSKYASKVSEQKKKRRDKLMEKMSEEL